VIGFEKPDPRFFAYALGASGAAAETTVHVGDMYYQDVQGSRAAGVHSVLLDPYGDWKVEDCERCRDLGDVVERIKGARARR
jgi:putative hydrolase of the HAD superfamily